MKREREELGFEDEAREQPAQSTTDALFALTETRAERRIRRLHADPRALAKEREQRPAWEARQAAERAAVPQLQAMIDAMEAYFGCDLLEVTQDMIDASIFKRPSGAVEAAERELAIISQLGLSASGMGAEDAARVEALRDQLIKQYREMTPEQVAAEERARKEYIARWREEHLAAVSRQHGGEE